MYALQHVKSVIFAPFFQHSVVGLTLLAQSSVHHNSDNALGCSIKSEVQVKLSVPFGPSSFK